MSSLAIIGLIIGGAVALGGFLLNRYGASQKRLGAEENHNVEQAKADEAKGRANEVLAEHRDPDDVRDRLRRHDF